MLGRTNTGGGGGGGLNFRVVGGTTQPTNPKENDIWINTDADITGWSFRATEPANPVEGMVWIKTGNKSAVEFNALKKNGLHVYPLSAKQHVSGAWVDVTAQSYQDGAWVQWISYLFLDGEQFTDVTGGYTTFGDTTIADSIVVPYAGSGAGFTTENPIDMAGFNTLVLEGAFLTYTVGSAYLGVTSSKVDSALLGQRDKFSAYAPSISSSVHTVEIDVSGINSGYIASIGSMTATVTAIYLKG